MSRRLEGKVVLITGGSSGLGRAAAFAAAREGAAVVVAARRAAETEETAWPIRERGGRATAVIADVSDEREVEALVEAAVRGYGRVDVAFNNAGVFPTEGPLHTLDARAWQAIVDVNLRGTFLCMKHEIPHMLAQGGGSIVNMASSAGLVGWSDAPIYTASKWGVLGLTRSAALQYGPAGIRINAVCPAFTRIEMFEAIAAEEPAAEERMRATIPLGRLGTMEEIAEAVVWLASDAASFRVGHALALDGGQTAGLW